MKSDAELSKAQRRFTIHKLRKLTHAAWAIGSDYITLKRQDLDALLVQVKNENVYYNVGEEPIFIVTKTEWDPLGGPANWKQTFGITPGQGIDLSILNLSKDKPERKK